MHFFSEPFYHITIDDFLHKDLYNTCMQHLDFRWKKDTGNKMREWMTPQLLEPFDDFVEATIWPIMEDIYKEPIPWGYHDHRLSWLDPHTSHRGGIHDEEYNKFYSLVVYIDPVESTGTLLYDENQNFVKEVEWKPNRALLFKGIPKITWHNYENNTDQVRFTFNSFWRTD